MATFAVYTSSSVQTRIAREAASWLSRKLHTTVSLSYVKIKDVRYVEIGGLLLKDLTGDTLIYVKSLRTDLLSYHALYLTGNTLNVHSVELNDGKYYLKQHGSGSNMDFLIRFFSSGKSTGAPFTLRITQLRLQNFHFKLANFGAKSAKGLFNPEDLDFSGIDLDAHHIFNRDDSVTASITNLSFKERSGFKAHLATQLSIGSKQMLFARLHFKTPYSSLGNDVEFHYKKLADLNDFAHLVHIKANFRESSLSSRDLSYFAKSLKSAALDCRFSTRVDGTTDNLYLKNFALKAGKGSEVLGDFHLRGLTKSKALLMELTFKNLKTTAGDMETFSKEAGVSVPKFLNTFGTVSYQGTVTGSTENQAVKGVFTTELGTVNTDVKLQLTSNPSYRGFVTARNFDLGRLLGDTTIGKISLSSDVKGRGDQLKNLSLAVNTHLSSIKVGRYTLHDVYIHGKKEAEQVTGEVIINDPGLKATLNGNVFLSAVPRLKIACNISSADLRLLGISKDSIGLTTNLDAEATGHSLADVRGVFKAGRLIITRGHIQHVVDSITLTTDKKYGARTLNLRSSAVDADLTGNYRLETFPSAVKKILVKYVPSGPWGKIEKTSAQDLGFNVHVKNAEPILSAFLPGYRMPGESIIQGKFEGIGRFSTSGSIKEFDAGDVRLYQVSFEGENEERQNIDFNVSIDSIMLRKTLLARNINLANNIYKDSLFFNVKISDVSAPNHLDLNGQVAFADRVAGLSILPSILVLSGKSWEIANKFNLLFSKGGTHINGFKIGHDAEQLTIGGVVSSDKQDTVTAQFQNFDIAAVNELLKETKVGLGGSLNGKAFLSSTLSSPAFSSTLGVDSFSINQVMVGKLDLKSNWNTEEDALTFDGNIHRKDVDVVKLKGSLGVSSKNRSLNASLKMNQANAIILQPLISSEVSDLNGYLSSDIEVSGTRIKPLINGRIRFENTEFTVNYLKTHYRISDELSFEKGHIRLNKFKITDPYYVSGRPNIHRALASGDINLTDLEHPMFDVNMKTNNFLALNTEEKDNSQYYGVALATGDCDFEGPLQTMNLDIYAKTEAGTALNIPLNNPSTAGLHDYIALINHKDSVVAAKKRKNLHAGVSLDLNFNITPEASIKLIFDKSIGDVIKAAGNAGLELQVTPEGEFLVFGSYEIDRGDYLFTSQNVLNKLFTVERGGSVRFTGDPLTAQMNLHADYQARTSIKNLYDAANVQPYNASALDQSVLVGCKINLTGPLNRPEFDFDLVFPNDPNIAYDLQTYLASNEVVTSQSMLFLVSNQFNGKLTPGNGLAIATSTGVQFIGSQLSNLLTNFSAKVDLNFRSLSDFGFNYHAFGDRMLLTGNLASTDTLRGVGYNPLALIPQQRNKVTGNVELDYFLDKKRSLSFRAFEKPVPLDILPDGVNTNALYSPGIGIVYQKDFSSIKSLFKKLKNRRRKN